MLRVSEEEHMDVFIITLTGKKHSLDCVKYDTIEVRCKVIVLLCVPKVMAHA